MIWTVLLTVYISSLSFALREEHQCPRKEDIKCCDCKVYHDGTFIETNVKCKPMHVNELRKAFVNLRGNKNLNIIIEGFGILKAIPSDLFKGLDVISLEFQDHKIVRFGDEGRSSFEGLEDTLERLYIYEHRDKKPLEFLNITAMNVLQALEISNDVPTLGNDLFAKGPFSVKILDIRSRQAREIGDKVFEKLINLKFLRVSVPILADLRRSMFPSPAPYLEHLDLSYNRISSLPEDMFIDMPSLSTVELKSNFIARLPEATWSAVWPQLEKLHLDGNPLECDNHIEWMFRIRRPKYLYATCEAPEYYKDIELKRVIERNMEI